MTDLTALLERVRAATGADRELDAAILCALPPFGVNWKPDARWQGRANFEHSSGNGDSRRSAPFTASIDAALALTERQGWRLYTVDASLAGRFNVLLAGPKRSRWSDELECEVTIPDYASGVHEDFCLAILAALLSALIAQAQP